MLHPVSAQGQYKTSIAPTVFDSLQSKEAFVKEALVDFSPFITKTVLDRISTKDAEVKDVRTYLDLLIQLTSNMTFEDPDYSKVAARFLLEKIQLEAEVESIFTFSDSFLKTHSYRLTSSKTLQFVLQNAQKLNDAIEQDRNKQFEFFGLRTVYDRYLLKHPQKRTVLETPQFFYMRVACGLSDTAEEAIDLYKLISSFDFSFSTPTLFNSATRHPQLSSCFLLDSPLDDLKSIYQKYTDVAMLSKFSGGIGVAYHRVRSNGSLIRSTNGKSNGIIPWLKTLDSSVMAVNQGGKRKGAACVYLETWHADIESFLELRENTGDEARRTHNLNLANWIPDLFMKRVSENGLWSLFDPKVVPHFPDLYGEDFEKAYLEAESAELYVRQIDARDLYGRMMRTLAETGQGWMTFKDASNSKCNQTGNPNRVVHLSNLCTEITEVTSNDETAVCNLGSINLAQHVVGGKFDFQKLEKTARKAAKYLDRVIDRNFYPTDQARHSNKRWRPIGLGIMGLQDVFFKLNMKMDSEEALSLSNRIQETVYYAAVSTSCELAESKGPHLTFFETRAAKGHLQFDLWNVTPHEKEKWEFLKARIKKHGLRNSLLLAIAPTATIASIVGCYEAIEPQVSNLFKRETMSGEFLQVNKYLVATLKEMNLWNDEIRNQIKMGNGSIQHIEEIPQEIRDQYRTVWEYSMKSLIDLAAGRGPFLDQSQSLNLFQESPNIGKLSSMYFYAWQKGLKTTYYLRSRPATEIKKTTVGQKSYTTTEAVACSLENPEECEACQ
ncbi:MAG: ribonucleoside-diphosphate reductase subunit alpha [Bdellovibrionales bacterium]|nr:ribonucleoside-diphosphate reductase subunit alpha [Bdellovibrionales bacterium]